MTGRYVQFLFGALLLTSMTVEAAAHACSALFEDGQSIWRIQVPAERARPIDFAATELTNVIARISGGVSLGIVSTEESDRGPVICLRLQDDKSGDDVFRVEADPAGVVLSGNSPRAVLFAVYAFLRDCLGARWYWPGPSGEYLPQMRRFDVPTFAKTYRSPFRYREMSICGSLPRHRHPLSERWFAKVFLNCGATTLSVRKELGFVNIAADHWIGLSRNKAESEPVFRAHPDWFSLVDGKRTVENCAGCWSNAAFTDWLVERLDTVITKNNPDIAAFMVSDLRARCECPACTREPDPSARFWSYYARLRAALRQRHPAQRFAGIAYMEYMTPPPFPVDDLEYVEYAHYDRCWYHRLEDPSCAKNAASLAALRNWREKAPLGIYGYEFDVFNRLLYLPDGLTIEEAMRIYRKMGVMRVKTEYTVDLNLLDGDRPIPRAQVAQLVNRLSNYVWACCAFDPDTRFEDVLADYCQHVYGAAAEPMRAYHARMAEAWVTLPIHSPWNYHNFPLNVASRLLTPEVQKEAETLLAKAREAVRDDPRAAGEVGIEAASFAEWVRLAEDARTGRTTYEMPERHGKDVFATLPVLRLRPLRHPSQETRLKLYRDRRAVHLKVFCDERDPDFDRGAVEADRMDWQKQSVEIFVDAGDGAKRQIAVSPAGGVWDAKDGDLSWSSKAEVRTAFSGKKWEMEIALPFERLGGEPANGARWKMMVIRNAAKGSGLASSGWPVAAHGDFGLAATLEFSHE